MDSVQELLPALPCTVEFQIKDSWTCGCAVKQLTKDAQGLYDKVYKPSLKVIIITQKHCTSSILIELRENERPKFDLLQINQSQPHNWQTNPRMVDSASPTPQQVRRGRRRRGSEKRFLDDGYGN